MDKEEINKNEPEENNDISEELYQRFIFNADKGQEPYRIDKFLMNRIEGATRNKLQQAINTGLILVNNKEVKQNYKVKAFDQIIVYSDLSPESTEIVPEKMDLNIVHEDDDILMINSQRYGCSSWKRELFWHFIEWCCMVFTK
jgi:23S rRNA pseudouridine1911/1915/1917 synthase